MKRKSVIFGENIPNFKKNIDFWPCCALASQPVRKTLAPLA